MLAIKLGSFVAQDPSWGGAGTLPVPTRPGARTRFAHSLGPSESAFDVPTGGVSVLSLSLFGLVKIDWRKGTP